MRSDVILLVLDVFEFRSSRIKTASRGYEQSTDMEKISLKVKLYAVDMECEGPISFP